MEAPEPDLEVGEGAVPAEYHDDQCKGQACQVENLYRTVPDPCQSAEDQEDDPEQVHEHRNVGKYAEHHRSDIIHMGAGMYPFSLS